MQAALRYFVSPSEFKGIAIGKVIHTYPQANMVDVLMFDGSIFQQVQVVSMSASSSGGSVGLTAPIYESDRGTNYIDPAKQTESDVFAVIGFVGLSSQPRPICLGFLFPEENEVLCDRTQAGNEDGTMFLWKHPSNVYVRVAKGKDLEEGKTPEIEVSHPSGCFIKIGKVDYTKGFDEQLTVVTNYNNKIRPFKMLNPENDEADIAPSILIGHPSGTYIVVMPSGETWIHSQADLGIEAKGNLTETIDGNVTRTINGTLTEHVVGNVALTYDADLGSSVGGNETSSVDGDVTRDVTGSETDTVTGAWERNSDASIEDSAPSVTHN